MGRRVVILALLLAGTTAGCDLLGSTPRTLTVQHFKAECVGALQDQCLLIKAPNQSDFGLLDQEIEGFHYQWGFVYEIEVEEHSVTDPPQDGSSVRIVLSKQISKTRVDPGTTFDLVLRGGAGSIIRMLAGPYKLYAWPEFTCDPGVSCPDLMTRLLAGKRVHFKFKHPVAPSDPLVVVSWEECSRPDAIFVCNP